MKKFLIFAVVFLFAVLFAKEIEIGFPANYRAWRFTAASDVYASMTCTGWLGKPCLYFDGEFPGKKRFQTVNRMVEITCATPLEIYDFKELKIEYSGEMVKEIFVRYVDATGQTFQYRYKVKPGSAWQFLHCRFDNASAHFVPVCKPMGFWGGAKDGIFHFPLKKVCFGIDCADYNVEYGYHGDFIKFYLGKITVVTRD